MNNRPQVLDKCVGTTASFSQLACQLLAKAALAFFPFGSEIAFYCAAYGTMNLIKEDL